MTDVVEETWVKGKPRRLGVGDVGAVLAAGLLLFAAAMKWWQLPVIDRMGEGLLHDPYVAAAQAVCEAGLAIWLLSGIGRLWSRRVALAVFAVFACVAAYRGIAGKESCGCFGEFKVNPWVTFVMDLAVVGMLLRDFRLSICDLRLGREDAAGVVPRWRLPACVAAMVAVVLLAGWRVWDRPALAADGLTVAGNLIVLEPERWVGKRLPILPHMEVVDGGSLDEVMRGEWRMVIYNSDCDHCREVVPLLLRRINGRVRNEGAVGLRWCFVRVPGWDEEELVPAGSGVLRARLTAAREWFASTPGVVEMAEGLVRSGAEGSSGERRVSEWSEAMH